MTSIPEIDIKKTGENIKRLFKEKGLKPRDVGAVLCMSEKSVYKWLEGKCLPSVNNLLPMAYMLEIPLEEIFVCEDRDIEDAWTSKTKKMFENQITLSNRMREFEKYFNQVEGEKMISSSFIPENLKRWEYNDFNLEIGVIGKRNYGGYFEQKSMKVRIGPNSVDDNVVILHEMIHMYEVILEKIPSIYRDKIYLELYHKLKEKVPNLDALIEKQTAIFEEQVDKQDLRTHDVLFFLKSLDLDLKMGYELKTIFEKRLERKVD